MKHKKLSLYLSSLLLFSACGNYQPSLPETIIPEAWKQEYPAEAAQPFKNRFWELFEDPILNSLEEEAIAANFDLKIAAYRIEEARALVSKEHAKRLPEVGASAIATADQTLINPHFYGSPNHVERVEQRQYNLLADFSYEIDLWGKFKAQEMSAQHRAKAADWEYAFIYQTLVSDVATHYLRLRTLEEEIGFLTLAIASRKDSVALHECRVAAGLDPELDLSRAKLDLALIEVEIEQSRRQYALEQNALATLLGKPASSWSLPQGSLSATLPGVPPLLPSEVIMQRADVQQKWALVAATQSDVSVAMKDYFPSFPLTASTGLSSPALSHLFDWQARYWLYAFNALMPLYDGGRRNAQVAQAKARFHSAFATYQKTVNQAFQDVEDALSILHYTQLQFDAQTRALDAARDTSYLAKQRYETGLISFLLIADAENTSLEAARHSITLRGDQLLAWVRLMRALGIQACQKTPGRVEDKS